MIPPGYSGTGGGREGAQAECAVPETREAGGQRLGLGGKNGPDGPSVFGSRCGARRPRGLPWEGHGDNLRMAMNGRSLCTRAFGRCGSAGARMWPRRWPLLGPRVCSQPAPMSARGMFMFVCQGVLCPGTGSVRVLCQPVCRCSSEGGASATDHML